MQSAVVNDILMTRHGYLGHGLAFCLYWTNLDGGLGVSYAVGGSLEPLRTVVLWCVNHIQSSCQNLLSQ